MKQDSNFIITQDADLKDILLLNGFVLLDQHSDFYTFVNEPSKLKNLTFEVQDKLVFTNALHF